jgi:hypothetical protein
MEPFSAKAMSLCRFRGLGVSQDVFLFDRVHCPNNARNVTIPRNEIAAQLDTFFGG